MPQTVSTSTPKSRALGARIRKARKHAGLSQLELANGIAHITKTKTSKGLVSRWEAGLVSSPGAASVLAVTAMTGFAQQWLLTGKGPEDATLPVLRIAGKDTEARSLLRRAVLIACAMQTTPEGIAAATIDVYETLADEPAAPDGALRRIARQAH